MWPKNTLILVGFAVAVLSAATPVLASSFMPGDVFVSQQSGHVQWRSASGALKGTINTGAFGEQAGMVFDAFGVLHVTNFNDKSVSRIDSNGNVLANFATG